MIVLSATSIERNNNKALLLHRLNCLIVHLFGSAIRSVVKRAKIKKHDMIWPILVHVPIFLVHFASCWANNIDRTLTKFSHFIRPQPHFQYIDSVNFFSAKNNTPSVISVAVLSLLSLLFFFYGFCRLPEKWVSVRRAQPPIIVVVFVLFDTVAQYFIVSNKIELKQLKSYAKISNQSTKWYKC